MLSKPQREREREKRKEKRKWWNSERQHLGGEAQKFFLL
jgi:hypothetical protein